MTPRESPRELCKHCNGNGVVKINHGVSVCPQCKGYCWVATLRAVAAPVGETMPDLECGHNIESGEVWCGECGTHRKLARAHQAEIATLRKRNESRKDIIVRAENAEATLARVRETIAQLVTEMDNAARRHMAHWEEERGKAMLEVAHELKAILLDNAISGRSVFQTRD